MKEKEEKGRSFPLDAMTQRWKEMEDKSRGKKKKTEKGKKQNEEKRRKIQEEEEEEWKGKKEKEGNSRPRSIYGQQYSCPAFLFFPDFPIVSRAAAPEGQCPVKYRGYFVRP